MKLVVIAGALAGWFAGMIGTAHAVCVQQDPSASSGCITPEMLRRRAQLHEQEQLEEKRWRAEQEDWRRYYDSQRSASHMKQLPAH